MACKAYETMKCNTLKLITNVKHTKVFSIKWNINGYEYIRIEDIPLYKEDLRETLGENITRKKKTRKCYLGYEYFSNLEIICISS